MINRALFVALGLEDVGARTTGGQTAHGAILRNRAHGNK